VRHPVVSSTTVVMILSCGRPCSLFPFIRAISAIHVKIEPAAVRSILERVVANSLNGRPVCSVSRHEQLRSAVQRCTLSAAVVRGPDHARRSRQHFSRDQPGGVEVRYTARIRQRADHHAALGAFAYPDLEADEFLLLRGLTGQPHPSLTVWRCILFKW
jgi:hypothetical protein